jgi:apolipoprotein N-acyltransferase
VDGHLHASRVRDRHCGVSTLLGLAGLATPPGRARALALPAALAITELVRYHAPFGGVPLSMTALTQAEGPLAPIARLGGPLLLTIGIAAVGVGLEAAIRRRWTHAAAAIAPVLVIAVLGAVAPSGNAVRPAGRHRSGRRPAGHGGVEHRPGRRVRLPPRASRSVPGDGAVDLVLWPENVVNVSNKLATDSVDPVLAAEARRLARHWSPAWSRASMPTIRQLLDRLRLRRQHRVRY